MDETTTEAHSTSSKPRTPKNFTTMDTTPSSKRKLGRPNTSRGYYPQRPYHSDLTLGSYRGKCSQQRWMDRSCYPMYMLRMEMMILVFTITSMDIVKPHYLVPIELSVPSLVTKCARKISGEITRFHCISKISNNHALKTDLERNSWFVLECISQLLTVSKSASKNI